MGTKRVAQQRLQWPAQWTGRPSSHTFPPALGPSASPSLLRLTVIDQPPTPSRNCQLGRAYFFDPQAFRLTDGSWEDLVVPSICSHLYSRHAKSTAIAFFSCVFIRVALLRASRFELAPRLSPICPGCSSSLALLDAAPPPYLNSFRRRRRRRCPGSPVPSVIPMSWDLLQRFFESDVFNSNPFLPVSYLS